MFDTSPSTYRLDAIEPQGALAAGVGFTRQVMAADLVTRGDGWERGLRCVQLQNDLISLEVVIDRGLDIGSARIRQVPVGWRSPTEIVAPWFVENSGFGPHRSFFGGLLKTCGLDHFGMPLSTKVPEGAQVSGEYPMHGRISGAPARLGSYGIRPVNGRLEAYVEGSVTQVAVFDEHLTLDRRVSITSGTSVIHVDDTVTNHGFKESSLAVLYHVNIGWPILTPGARLSTPARLLRGTSDYADIVGPSKDGQSRGWMFESDKGGDLASAAISNPHIDAGQAAGLRLRWKAGALPTMGLWQNTMLAGNYVLALEPTTMLAAATPSGRHFPMLQPGESVKLGVEIELLHGSAGAALI